MHSYAMLSPAAGRLLVAHPEMEDPNFSRSVVYLLAHSADGTLGVVLNRPNQQATPSFDSPLMPWFDVAAAPQMIFDGGPVDINAILCLHPDPTETSGVRSVDVTWDDPAMYADHIRIFQGYSGWSPGQLEMELSVGGWFVIEGSGTDVIYPEPELLWRHVLSRQPNELQKLADFPDDLTAN